MLIQLQLLRIILWCQYLSDFLKAFYDHEPQSYLVSIRGYNFDFNAHLSLQAKTLISPAAAKIMQLLKKKNVADMTLFSFTADQLLFSSD
jgi:hypothetical protein